MESGARGITCVFNFVVFILLAWEQVKSKDAELTEAKSRLQTVLGVFSLERDFRKLSQSIGHVRAPTKSHLLSRKTETISTIHILVHIQETDTAVQLESS